MIYIEKYRGERMERKLSDDKGRKDGKPMGAGVPTKNLLRKAMKGERSVEILIGIGTLCVIVTIGLLATGDLREYLKAKRLFSSQDYEQAAIIFKELADYREADNLYHESMYCVGKNQYEKGNYVTAIDTLSAIDNYEKAQELLEQVNYEYGCMLLEEKKYQEAILHLQNLQIDNSAALYEKSLALSTSNIYNGLFYITPAQIKAQVESSLAMNPAGWKLTEITKSEDSDTFHYYILDADGKALNAYISFFEYDEKEGTVSSIAFTYDHEKVIGDGISRIITSIIQKSDSASSYEDALHICSELQLQLQTLGDKTSQVFKYECNNIEYLLDYNTKTSIYLLTPIQ